MSATSACQPTQSLEPVTQWWSPQAHWHPGSYAGQPDAEIIMPLPATPEPPLNFSIQTPHFQVTLENETIQPIVGGWFNCNALIYPAGHVFFEIHGIDSNGNDKLIDAIPVQSLGMPPGCLQEYDVSNYKYFYFKISAVHASHTGFSINYCAAIIVPLGFIARGTLPPPSQTANIQVFVYDSSSMAPIHKAMVTLTDSGGYVNQQETTQSNGVAYFNSVPFSTSDTYYFSVTASHYKSGSATYTGQEIESNNYYIRIPLTPEESSVLGALESFAKDVGIALIVVGVAAAGFAVYKVLSKSGFTFHRPSFRRSSKKSEETQSGT